MTHSDFVEHFNANHLAGKRSSTATAYLSTLSVFERATKPKRLSDVTTQKVAAFSTHMREAGRSTATVARHLRHLKAAMRWAHQQGLLVELPKFSMPKLSKGARGRAITLEEFERMLQATEKVMGEKAARA